MCGWTRIKGMEIERCCCFRAGILAVWWMQLNLLYKISQKWISFGLDCSIRFFELLSLLSNLKSYEMHSTTVLACHSLRGKNKSWEHDFWPCRCYGACESCLIFGDPELRPSIGLSGLQGPVRIREKKEKERNELRDLVIQNYDTNSWESGVLYIYMDRLHDFLFSHY